MFFLIGWHMIRLLPTRFTDSVHGLLFFCCCFFWAGNEKLEQKKTEERTCAERLQLDAHEMDPFRFLQKKTIKKETPIRFDHRMVPTSVTSNQK